MRAYTNLNVYLFTAYLVSEPSWPASMFGPLKQQAKIEQLVIYACLTCFFKVGMPFSHRSVRRTGFERSDFDQLHQRGKLWSFLAHVALPISNHH